MRGSHKLAPVSVYFHPGRDRSHPEARDLETILVPGRLDLEPSGL